MIARADTDFMGICAIQAPVFQMSFGVPLLTYFEGRARLKVPPERDAGQAPWRIRWNVGKRVAHVPNEKADPSARNGVSS